MGACMRSTMQGLQSRSTSSRRDANPSRKVYGAMREPNGRATGTSCFGAKAGSLHGDEAAESTAPDQVQTPARHVTSIPRKRAASRRRVFLTQSSEVLTLDRRVLLVDVRLGHAHRDLLRVAQFDDLQFRFGLRCFVHDQLHQLKVCDHPRPGRPRAVAS